jgi:hypothetical protein
MNGFRGQLNWHEYGGDTEVSGPGMVQDLYYTGHDFGAR